MYNIYLEKIYTKKFGHSDDVKSLGWGSSISQQLRFKVLTEIGINFQDSILDVGCVYGDFSINFENYLGIDLRLKAIDTARQNYPSRKFQCVDIKSIEDSFDWVVASGIFCFKKNWKEITLETLNKMWSLSNKGIAVNFLSDLSNGKREIEMKYTKPSEIINMIQPLSSKFIIRHDYLPNDFTLYLYK